MREYHPTYYLSDEAAQKRMTKLIARIAQEGLRPGESVPMYVMVAADFRRGELAAA